MDDNDYRHHWCSQQDNGDDDNDNYHCIPCHFHHYDDIRPSPGKSPHHHCLCHH
ncbi:hypothetical protein SCLCIDRAFT_1099563 [Scleroderma citrinum Foug A]|uniref:Uncharacterized protein n=1 Tax=Scleroderma citrinum Foug A TaxID=1036808 RepID=A0A0C2Z8F7_9AGAM|nr:hypothetical protein SCLCIDRAFT_1099563 [Scleroderma citrinum Foug A]